MELSQVPIHQRLDALLERLDNSDAETDNLDYLQFVDRRGKQNSQPEPFSDPPTQNEHFEESDLENQEIETNEDIARPSQIVDDESDAENDVQRANSGAITEINEPVDVQQPQQRVQPRNKSAKQAQLETERAARDHQEMERMYGEDVRMHTVKTRTINSFLDDLSDNEGANEPMNPTENEAVKSDNQQITNILSSPPKMQGLRSFIFSPKAPSPGLKSNNREDSDSELEVIPETKTNRLSKSVKNLLKFSGGGGGTPSDRKLAQERAKLLKLEKNQINARRQARLAQLKEHGLNVDAMVEHLNTKRQQNAMTAQDLLEQEQKRASELQIAECDGRSDSDSDSDMDNSVVSRSRRMLMSDSDKEDEEEEDPVKTVKDLTTHDENTDDEDRGNANPDLHIGRTGTQYVPPLPQNALAEMLGAMNSGREADGEAENESDGDFPDTLPDSQNPNDNEEEGNENLEVVGDQNEMGGTMQPDLSDLKDKHLSMSQHMAEVRQRFLAAQAEQRRKRSSENKKRVKSVFVEDQAEESEDEENGGFGVRTNVKNDDNDDEDEDDENEDPDAELHGLVDHNYVAAKESELKKRFQEEEKLKDQRILNKLVEGVHGGFRRRRNNNENQFLSDDDLGDEDDAADEQMQQYLRAVEEKRKKNLMNNNARAGKLASNARAAAFFTSIAEDLVSRPATHRKSSVQESYEFLRNVAEMNNDHPQLPHAGHPVAAAAPTATEPPNDAALPRDQHRETLPTVDLSVRRTSTVKVPERVMKRGSTYASRISATDLGNAKTVEIMQSLNRPSESRKQVKNRLVAPSKPTPSAKRAKQLVTTAPKTGSGALFKRSWS